MILFVLWRGISSPQFFCEDPVPFGTGLRRFAVVLPPPLGQDYVADAPFSLALPRVILHQSKSTSCSRRTSFFARSSPLRERALDGRVPCKKKHSTKVECFCFGVIRTGFEPVTHSLEGCCSIQLSYRTIPFEGANIVVLRQFAKFLCNYAGFFLLMSFPAASIPVTRENPMRAKITAEAICGSIMEALTATAAS